LGFDIHGKTVGVIGSGKIGKAFINIMNGFGCRVLAYDKLPDEKAAKEMNFEYVDLDTLYKESDIISLHCLLTDENYKMINEELSILLTMPNVVVTSHQAFFTKEALNKIALDTCENIKEFFETGNCKNKV
jgi:D-lactate dehydrogenase